MKLKLKDTTVSLRLASENGTVCIKGRIKGSPSFYLIDFTPEGTIHLLRFVNSSLGFVLDDEGRICLDTAAPQQTSDAPAPPTDRSMATVYERKRERICANHLAASLIRQAR